MTIFQIKQKILKQLNLSLNYTTIAIEKSNETLSDIELDELYKIRLGISNLMKELLENSNEEL